MNRIAPMSATALCLFMTTSAYSATPARSDSVLGRYQAVTESEWNLELELRKDGIAIYTLSSYEADEKPRIISKTETPARWEMKNDVLSVTISDSKSGQVVTYEISACVPYKWFGGNGCSPGLRPFGTGMRQPYVQPLWNVKTFKFP
jgi:hypothetical protein